jgi:urease accessory protein
MAALENTLAETAMRAGQSSLDDLGSATFIADIMAMKHETQHSRLFRS